MSPHCIYNKKRICLSLRHARIPLGPTRANTSPNAHTIHDTLSPDRLSPELGADEALIRQVAEASSFDSMKEQAEGAGAGSVEAGGAGGKAAHLRKGVAGDWRNHFSPALQADFVERYRSEMAGSGIVFSLGEGEEDLA